MSNAHVRRVVVTGFGAVTPLGNDAPETWRAALAGESGIDWIRAFDADGFPVRVAAEVKDFDAGGAASAKEQRKLDRNVLLALAAGREAVEHAGLNGFDPHRVGIAFVSAASPSGVDVPCALMYPTSSGSTPARARAPRIISATPIASGSGCAM